MTHATIELGDRKFGRSSAGLMYCEIALVVDGQSFPDAHWTDFVVVVLGWWCDALSGIASGGRDPFEVRFMEGPYLVRVCTSSPGFLRIELVEAGLERRTRRSAEVEFAPLARSVVSAAEITLNECRSRHWWSEDADTLVEALAGLRQRTPERR